MRRVLIHSCFLGMFLLTAAYPQDISVKAEEPLNPADTLQVIRFRVGATSLLGKPPAIFMDGYPVSRVDWGSGTNSRKKNREGEDVTLRRLEELEWHFTMRTREMDTLRVDAFRRQERRELKSRGKSFVFSFGEDYVEMDVEPEENEVLTESEFLSAELDLPGREGFPWQLLIEDSSGETDYLNGGAIQNGSRVIRILQWNPRDMDTALMRIQVLGLEFVEGDESLGILEFFGSGSGKKQNALRVRSDLDPGLKLLLASASVAIIHMILL